MRAVFATFDSEASAQAMQGYFERRAAWNMRWYQQCGLLGCCDALWCCACARRALWADGVFFATRAGGRHVVHGKRAPEPDDVQWRFVETSAPRRRFLRALEVMAVAVLMCFTIGASVLLRYASDATVDADEAVCGAADDGGAAGGGGAAGAAGAAGCLLYTSPSPRDRTRSRMPSSA